VLKQLITIQSGVQQLGKDTANLGKKLMVRSHGFNKGDSGNGYLRALHSPNSSSSGPSLGDLCFQGCHLS